jgi:hypothetical protein
MNHPMPVPLRLGLMLVFIACTAFILSGFAQLIQHLLRIQYDWKFELFMVLGQLLFQFPFIFRQTAEKIFHYFYHMLFVSFLGSVLLSPLILTNHFYRLPDLVNIFSFFTVVLVMFIEHKRRVKRLSLPSFISYTWVAYRVIILFFILPWEKY